MEKKARKYCSLYKMQPTLAMACIYRELSQTLVNGLSELLQEWCLYVAECEEAIIDFVIPIKYDELYCFTVEVLSRKLQDKLVISRAVSLLKSQRAPMKNLNSSLQDLLKCKQSETVLVLRAIIYARMGKDGECVKQCKQLSNVDNLMPLRSRLHLTSNADLELLRLVMESHDMSKRSSTAGISNGGYLKEDHSVIETRSYASNEIILSSASDLHSTEIMETSFQDDLSTDLFLNEVVNTLSRVLHPDKNIGSIIDIHINAGRMHHAVWTLRNYYLNVKSLPELDVASTLQLHEEMMHTVKELNENFIDEKNSEVACEKTMNSLNDRAMIYCEISRLLDSNDTEIGLLYMDCLNQAGRTSDAISLGLELRERNGKDANLLQALAESNVNQGKYICAIDNVNEAMECSKEVPCLMSLRGFAHVLSGNLSKGAVDITSACKNETSIVFSKFRNLKLADQEKIKERISQNVRNCMESLVVKENSDTTDHETSKSQQDNNNKLHVLRCQCEFLTKLYQKDLAVHLLHVEILLRLERHEAAQEVLVLYIQRYPDNPFPMIHLANLRMRLGAYVAAVQDFRIINLAIGSARFAEYLHLLSASERQEIARVHRQHGFRYLHSDRSYPDAIECFDICIIALNGAATGLILVRGFCYANIGDYELALNDFLSVLEREPENTAAHVSKSVIYSVLDYEEETHRGLAIILKANKDAAISVLKKIPMRCVMVFATLLKNYVNKVLDEGTEYKDQLAFSTAGIYAEFLILIFKSAQYRCLYAKYLLHQRKYDDAVKEVEAVLRLEPDNQTALSQKIFLLAKTANARECLVIMRVVADTKELEKYIRLLSIREINELRSVVLNEAKGKKEAKENRAAIRWYNLALLIAGRKDIEILRGRFDAFIDEGLTEDGLRDITSIIEAKPTYEDYCIRAKLHTSLSMEKLAWNDYIKAMELDEERTVTLLSDQAILKHVLCLFCIAANGAFVRERYKDVLRLCDFGLKLDQNHKGLKQLRYRTKCVVNRCVIQ